MRRDVAAELIRLAQDWDQAMVQNDADAIGRYMADDWAIIGADGRMSDKATFLGLVRSGVLRHDTMTSDDVQVRLYGETALVMARGVSGGTYQGRPFREREQSTSVFMRHGGQWRCVLTHLSRLASDTP